MSDVILIPAFVIVFDFCSEGLSRVSALCHHVYLMIYYKIVTVTQPKASGKWFIL